MTDEQRMSTRKRRYDNRKAARFFAEADGLREYHCPVCGLWHLSSKGVRRRRPVR